MNSYIRKLIKHTSRLVSNVFSVFLRTTNYQLPTLLRIPLPTTNYRLAYPYIFALSIAFLLFVAVALLPSLTYAAAPAVTQSAFRLFTNSSATLAGTAGNLQPTSASLPFGESFGVVGSIAGLKRASAVVIDEDNGHMYVTGWHDSYGLRVEKRYLASGEPVTQFGQNGSISTPSGLIAYPRSLALDRTGTYLYVVGPSSGGGPNWIIQKRLASTGQACSVGVCAEGDFGTDGSVTSSGRGTSHATVLNNGYLYVAGESDGAGGVIEKRLQTTGALCTSGACSEGNFGIKGSVMSEFAVVSYRIHDIAVDGTHVYAVSEMDSGAGWAIQKRLTSTGQACSSGAGCDGGEFGTNGSVSSEFWIPEGIEIDGTYMYVGGTDTGSDFVIQKRLLTTGQACSAGVCADGEFGTNGSIFGTNVAFVGSITADTQRGYLYAGGVDDSNNWSIQKILLSDGSYCDGTYTSADACGSEEFGTGGIVRGPDETYWIYDLAYDNSGNLYAVGSPGISSDSGWNIRKYDSTTGAPDKHFGTGEISSSYATDTYSIAIDTAGGHMYTVGTDAGPGFVIGKRTLTSGTPVAEFGTNGSLFATEGKFFYGIAIDTIGGYMYIAGNDWIDSQNNWMIQKRLLATGEACGAGAVCDDGEFGVDGSIASVTGNFANDIAIDREGGYMYVVGTNGSAFLIQKRNLSDGSSVNSFGTDGSVTSASGERAEAIAIDIDGGYMYVTGRTSGYIWLTQKRRLTTGEACSASAGCNGGEFGIDGSVISSSGETAFDIAIDTSGGYMYVVGEKNGTNDWMIQKRLLTTGQACSAGVCTDGEFGTNGSVISPIGHIADAIAIDSASGYMYVAGDTDSSDWLIQKRLLSTGQACASGVCTTGTFGYNGSIFVQNGDYIYSIAIDTNAEYMYVVGDDDSSEFLIQKRRTSDGTLTGGRVKEYDTGFGSGENGTFGLVGSTTGSDWGLGPLRTAFATYADTENGYLYVIGQGTWGPYRIEKRYLVSGELVSQFGSNGIAKSELSTTSNDGMDIAVDVDGGYLYTVFTVYAGSNDDWVIQKRRTDTGEPCSSVSVCADGEFGIDGSVLSPLIGTTGTHPHSMVIDTSGGYMYVGGTDDLDRWIIQKRLLTTGRACSVGVCAAGTFGIDGSVASEGARDLLSLAIDISGGYIYAGGTWPDSSVLVQKRLLTTGQACSASVCVAGTFGTNGSLFLTGRTPIEVALDSAADYLYVISDYENNNNDWHIRKFLASSGGICTSGTCASGDFGAQGSIRVIAGYEPFSLAVDPTDDFIYIGGDSAADSTWRIEKRASSSGELCSGSYTSANICGSEEFGTQGVIAEDSSTGVVLDMVLDSSGNLYAIGDSTSSWNIRKYNSTTGAPDRFFGTGEVTSPNGFIAHAIAIDTSGGYMYVAGYDDSNDWVIQKRLTTTGQACSSGVCSAGTFGTDGSVTSPTGDQARAIAIDSNAGYMYVAGFTDGTNDWLIQKRKTSTGEACSASAGCDATFGTDGSVTSPNGNTAYAIAIDPNAGYMYVAGYDNSGNWLIQKRKLSTGEACSSGAGCDATFGTDGSVTSPTGNQARAIAIDSNAGYMYVAGYDDSNDWLIQKRKLSTGEACSASAGCDATFGTDGSVISPNGNQVHAIAIDTSGGYMYVAGFDNSNDWLIQKRLSTTGQACSSGVCSAGTFGTDGSVTSPNGNQLHAIAIDTSGGYMYVAGYDTSNDWVIQKRLTTTGQACSSGVCSAGTFGTDGSVTSQNGTEPNAIAIDTSGGYMYVAGYDTSTAWLIQKRRLSDGLHGVGNAFNASYSISTALAVQDTLATLSSAGETFRARVLLDVATASMSKTYEPYRLQYVDQGTGTCVSPAGGTPSTWTNVASTSSTFIHYKDLPNLSDGLVLSASTSLDPDHGTHATISQTFEESNPFINSTDPIYIGEDGLWDFSLKSSASSADCTTYCLRIVENNMIVTPSISYTFYPQITTTGSCPVGEGPDIGRGPVGSIEIGSGGGTATREGESVLDDDSGGSTEQGSGGGAPSGGGEGNLGGGGGASPILFYLLNLISRLFGI